MADNDPRYPYSYLDLEGAMILDPSDRILREDGWKFRVGGTGDVAPVRYNSENYAKPAYDDGALYLKQAGFGTGANSCPPLVPHSYKEFTVAGWFKWESSQGSPDSGHNHPLFGGWYYSSKDYLFNIKLQLTTGHFRIDGRGSYVWSDYSDEDYAMPEAEYKDTWFHVCGVGDEDKIVVYVNGKKAFTWDRAYKADYDNGGMFIGCYGSNARDTWWPGWIGGIVSIPKALSADQVTELYDGGRYLNILPRHYGSGSYGSGHYQYSMFNDGWSMISDNTVSATAAISLIRANSGLYAKSTAGPGRVNDRSIVRTWQANARSYAYNPKKPYYKDPYTYAAWDHIDRHMYAAAIFTASTSAASATVVSRGASATLTSFKDNAYASANAVKARALSIEGDVSGMTAEAVTLRSLDATARSYAYNKDDAWGDPYTYASANAVKVRGALADQDSFAYLYEDTLRYIGAFTNLRGWQFVAPVYIVLPLQALASVVSDAHVTGYNRILTVVCDTIEYDSSARGSLLPLWEDEQDPSNGWDVVINVEASTADERLPGEYRREPINEVTDNG